MFFVPKQNNSGDCSPSFIPFLAPMQMRQLAKGKNAFQVWRHLAWQIFHCRKRNSFSSVQRLWILKRWQKSSLKCWTFSLFRARRSRFVSFVRVCKLLFDLNKNMPKITPKCERW